MTQEAEAPRRETIEKLGWAPYLSFAMLAGMELGVFTPLREGPMTAEQIAGALDVGVTKLKPLLYALVVAELLTTDGDRFFNTPEASHYLAQGSPAYMSGRDGFFRERWSEVLQTTATIRSGAPQAKHDFSTMPPEEAEAFFRGLHWRAASVGRELAARYDLSQHRSLVDVGGGSGGLAIAIADAYPHIQATVVDLPTVTPLTQRYVEEAGATGRVQVMTADVVNGPLAGSYDVAVMRALIQVISAGAARRALLNVGKAINPGGTLYIVSTGLLDNSRLSPPEAVAFNLVFLNIYDHGQAYTEQEHRDWLAEAGFEGFERLNLPDASILMIAHKPG